MPVKTGSAGKIRIIAGSLRGRRIDFLPAGAARPTGSLVRGALFNILGGLVPGSDILDLYAGTGALGLEAVSRGARAATLVESDRQAADAIGKNIESLGLQQACRLVRGDAMEYLGRCRDKFDIITADPPYSQDASSRLLEAIAAGKILKPGGVFAYQHSPSVAAAGPPAPLAVWKSRRHGRTQVTFYRNDQE
jgi:16S rRNA (guanine966-N2)-methyltransferase